MRGCSSTTPRSSGVSGPGFRRIRSLIPILPTSCRSEPKTSSSRRFGSRPSKGHVVDPDDVVAVEHLRREAPRDRAVGRIVLEPLEGDEVEVPLLLLVVARKQEALLGVQQVESHAENEGADVAVPGEEAALVLHAHDLGAELGDPLTFPLPRLVEPRQVVRAGEPGAAPAGQGVDTRGEKDGDGEEHEQPAGEDRDDDRGAPRRGEREPGNAERANASTGSVGPDLQNLPHLSLHSL